MQLELKITDGGRSKYFKGTKNVGDCVTRAIAIASGKDYKEVYDLIRKVSGTTPRNGVMIADVRKVMNLLGYEWIPTMKVGQGVKVHLAKDEVPMNKRIVCSCSKHLVAVINGVVHDSYDSRRNGTRAVYGYWIVK